MNLHYYYYLPTSFKLTRRQFQNENECGTQICHTNVISAWETLNWALSLLLCNSIHPHYFFSLRCKYLAQHCVMYQVSCYKHFQHFLQLYRKTLHIHYWLTDDTFILICLFQQSWHWTEALTLVGQQCIQFLAYFKGWQTYVFMHGNHLTRCNSGRSDKVLSGAAH